MNGRDLVFLRTSAARISGERTLVDRYAGRNDHISLLKYAVPDQLDVELQLIDTSDTGDEPALVTAGGTVVWHVLWIRDEHAATVTVTSGSAATAWPIAPGDTLLLPAGASIMASGDQLALAISRTVPTASPIVAAPPTHGVDRFFGHNRQSTYPAVDGMRTSRWKLTQPLDLAAHYEKPIILVSLAGDPAIASARESSILRRGDAVLMPGTEATTILPNGLAYVVVIDLTMSGPQ